MILATVTCMNDLKDMIRQSQSIERFVSNCTHYVVINEEKPDLKFWEETLSKYYTNNKLIVLQLNWKKYLPMWKRFFKIPNGYNRQQLLKLIVSKEIKSDYLILDSKDFFIKEPDYNYWDTCVASERIVEFCNLDYDQKIWIAKYFDYFSVDIPKYFYNSLTPYKIKYEIVKQLTDKDLKWFFNQKDMYEFLFYNVLLWKHKMYKKLSSSNLKNMSFYNPRPFIRFPFQNKYLDIISVHRHFTNTMNDQLRCDLNNFLKHIGLDTKY